MLKKWFEIIFDHRISLRERMFRVVTGISMVALTIILLMGRSFANLLILAASLAFITAIVKFSIRNERIHTGATAIAVLLLVVFPISFLRQAGFTADCPSGLLSALSISASLWREGVSLSFTFCGCWKHWFAIMLLFIIPNM